MSGRTWGRAGRIALVFGLGVLAGRSEQRASEARWLPVAGRGPSGTGSEDLAEAERNAASVTSSELDARPGARPESAASIGAARPAEAPGRAVAAPPAWSEVATRAQQSTVGILAGDRYGAGIIVDHSGLVLTNLHVIQGIDRISVLLFGNQSVAAKLLDQAADLDLALLQLSNVTADGKPLEQELPVAAALGSVHGLQVGDDVLAVGSPRKMYFSVSRGMVSYLDRKLDKISYIQSDLPINAGNSGGPLLDREGHVIGVVSFILRDSQGIAFALPIDYARERFASRLERPAQLPMSEVQPCGAAPCPAGASG